MGCIYYYAKTIFISIILLILLIHTSAFGAKLGHASIVMEYPTKHILFSENPDQPHPPASLTKVMTLYLIFQAIDRGILRWDQMLPISRKAASRQASKLGLKANQTISVRDIVCGLVTKSANDAASVIAEFMGGTEAAFAELMNQQAFLLGMHRTNFTNASGIPDNQQYTTAYDMAILGSAIIRDFPHHYHYFKMKQFIYYGTPIRNHNRLLEKYAGCDGLKTGYVNASGYNLLSSASRDGHRIVAVVLGGTTPSSRDKQMIKLLDQGFAKYKAKQQINHDITILPSIIPETPNQRIDQRIDNINKNFLDTTEYFF